MAVQLPKLPTSPVVPVRPEYSFFSDGMKTLGRRVGPEALSTGVGAGVGYLNDDTLGGAVTGLESSLAGRIGSNVVLRGTNSVRAGINDRTQSIAEKNLATVDPRTRGPWEAENKATQSAQDLYSKWGQNYSPEVHAALAKPGAQRSQAEHDLVWNTGKAMGRDPQAMQADFDAHAGALKTYQGEHNAIEAANVPVAAAKQRGAELQAFGNKIPNATALAATATGVGVPLALWGSQQAVGPLKETSVNALTPEQIQAAGTPGHKFDPNQGNTTTTTPLVGVPGRKSIIDPVKSAAKATVDAFNNLGTPKPSWWTSLGPWGQAGVVAAGGGAVGLLLMALLKKKHKSQDDEEE